MERNRNEAKMQLRLGLELLEGEGWRKERCQEGSRAEREKGRWEGREITPTEFHWIKYQKSEGIINNPLLSAVKGEALPLFIVWSSLWEKEELCYGQKTICLSILIPQPILRIQGWSLFSSTARTGYPLGQRQLNWNSLLTTNFRLAWVTHCLQPIAYTNTTNCIKLLEGFCHN